MEFIPTRSLESPLKGFLVLSPSTQEKKDGTIYSKLDDKPRMYVIGTMQSVNQKIADFKVGLKKFDSSDVVIKDASSKRHSEQKKSGQTRRQSRAKEKECKAGRASTDPQPRSRTPQKKAVPEKDKLVELYQYPGYNKQEPTPLPNGMDLEEIVEKVVRAQGSQPIGKTNWSLEVLRRFLNAPCTQAILLDSFWWFFLHLYHPDVEIQGYLFDCISENYARILLGCHKVSNQENILKFFPSLLSQTVYTCFCSCFSRSWFNTPEFKGQLCDVFCEWLGGILHSPGDYNQWDYSQLEPERSRREDLLATRNTLGPGDGGPFGAKTSGSPETSSKRSPQIQKRPQYLRKSISKPPQDLQKLSSKSKDQHPPTSRALHGDLLKQKDSRKKQRSTPKKRIKIAYLHRQSHPACCGPEFTWHLLNIAGRSPLIQHFLQNRNCEPKSGCDIFVSRRQISKPFPDSAETYADLIKTGFSILHQRHKAYMKAYMRNRREMKHFDQQCKDNLELFRQEEEEEIKKQKAEKKKELFSLRPEGLDAPHKKISYLLPKITVRSPDLA